MIDIKASFLSWLYVYTSLLSAYSSSIAASSFMALYTFLKSLLIKKKNGFHLPSKPFLKHSQEEALIAFSLIISIIL